MKSLTDSVFGFFWMSSMIAGNSNIWRSKSGVLILLSVEQVTGEARFETFTENAAKC